MVEFLCERGYKMTLYFATNKNKSILQHSNYTIEFFDNFKLYEYLELYYENEKHFEYQEYMQQKVERLKKRR